MMSQISIALVCATLLTISACSDNKEETTSNADADTNTSEQSLSDETLDNTGEVV